MIIGCDVGSKGGISFIEPLTNKVVYLAFDKLQDYKEKLPRMIKTILDFREEDTTVYVCIEDVHSLFVSGKKENFNFGLNKGYLIGVFNTLATQYDIDISLVAPKIWQNNTWLDQDKVYVNTGKVTKKDTKATSLNCAKRLYPHLDFLATERSRVPHDGIVDAVLIAHYKMKSMT